MRVAVVFESMMGNTHAVADAIAVGAGTVPGTEVVLCRSAAELLDDPIDLHVDLLVVGTPTHFFGMPGERSRRMWVDGQFRAERRGRLGAPLEPGAAGPGVREWIEGLPEAEPGSSAATFDTRLDKPLAGGAGPRIARRLRSLGYDLVTEPEGFVVEDMEGPLRPGELERARAWAERLPLKAMA